MGPFAALGERTDRLAPARVRPYHTTQSARIFMERLRALLDRIDGRGYKAYKDLAGTDYRFPGFTLRIDHVQGDPFAAPSRARLFVPASSAGLPDEALSPPPRQRAARDFLARGFARLTRREEDLAIDAGAQTVLDRSAALIHGGDVELRFTVNLPAQGRRILGRKARQLLCERLPELITALLGDNLDRAGLRQHCDVVEDQVALRDQLAERGCAAFVADGALLPRRSGIDDRPLADAVAFEAPTSLRITLNAPNAGQVAGMGLGRGITLIVGGGFHGKSTLLNALSLGVYDHIPGDGRERIVTDPDAVKIRAEDGRAVHSVDLSPFINHLPFGKATDDFTTELASGSTSQAAALQEALECGVKTLLVDEDTSATNFMIRDERMQALVAKRDEPITPFVDRIRELRDNLGVATILVMGGSGDYFDAADTIIQMHDYAPLDVTEKARRIAAEHVTGRHEEIESRLGRPRPRLVERRSLDPSVKSGKRKLKVPNPSTLLFGRDEIDLRAIEQLADPSQLRAIGVLLTRLGEGSGSADPVEWLREILSSGDWQQIPFHPDGDLALPRLPEAMAALNRLRSARLHQQGG